MRSRRAFLRVGFMSVLILCGCSVITENVPEVQTAFSATVSVTMGENEVICTVSRLPEGAATICLTSPETVQGITYKWLNGDCSISYGELLCETDSIFLPDNSFVCCLEDIWTVCGDDTALSYMGDEDNQAVFEGVCDSGEFTVYVDSQSGLIQKIVLPSLDMEAVFEDCKAIT